MGDCLTKITKNITSNCQTQKAGGLEVKAWIVNRENLTYVQDATNKVLLTSIGVAATTQLYTLTGVKKLLNAGFDRVPKEDRADVYTHYFSFQQFEIKAEDVENVDNIQDAVVIVENKDKTDDGDGVFEVYGLKLGLYPSSDTRRSNDINGARSLELTSLADQEEAVSRYILFDTDYATTKALIEGLETPA